MATILRHLSLGFLGLPDQLNVKPMATTHTVITQTSNTIGTAGFITSIVGLLTCGCLSPLGLLFSLLGLLSRPRGFAFAGTILGVIGSWWLWAMGFAIVAGLVMPATKSARDTAIEMERRNQAEAMSTTSIEPTVEVPEPQAEPTPEPTPIPVEPPAIVPPPEKPPVEPRTFQDASGKFSVFAKFLRVEDGVVILERVDNGNIAKVPLDRLSDGDRQWVEENAK